MNGVERIYEEFNSLIVLASNKGDISQIITINDIFKKILTLSAASYFETEICRILEETISNRSNDDKLVLNFVKNKAIKRQYHTFFAWNSKSANSFFGLFGDDFKKSVTMDIKSSEELDDSIMAFMDIGSSRNDMVHTDFANFQLNKTPGDVYEQYKKAHKFIEYIEEKFKE
ncbi:MAG: hypothetical protein HQK89_09305 [Nitrospirae bacterium]|nr:hypothetical protein [Nitrospirota bacterium]